MRRASTVREWRWWAIFCRAPQVESTFWMSTISDITALLPRRWKTYLVSWNNFSSLTPATSTSKIDWSNIILSPSPPIHLNSNIPLSWFTCPGVAEGQHMQPTSFSQTTAALVSQNYPIILPLRFSITHQLSERSFRRYWEFLRKARAKIPDEEGTAHLLSLGSLHPGAHIASIRNIDLFPFNASKNCVLCLSDDPETLQHLLVDCPFSKSLWSQATTKFPHPTLSNLICPPITRAGRGLIALNILFIHTIWRFARSRRFSKQNGNLHLAPIDATTLTKMARNLELDWKFSGLHWVFSG